MENIEYREAKNRELREVEKVSTLEELDKVVQVETSQGSVYTYLENGKTQRNKIREGKDSFESPQDILVYVDYGLDISKEQDFLKGFRNEGKKLYVVNKEGDIIRSNEQARNEEKLFLVLTNADKSKVFDGTRATIFPAIGLKTYDQRSYNKEEGKKMTERHMGNTVTKIHVKG